MILAMNEQEQAQYQEYIDAYIEDYPGLSKSDLIQLQDAAIFHILAQRFISSSAPNKQYSDARTHPKTIERNILDDIGANRKQRLARKQEDNDTVTTNSGTTWKAKELKSRLMSLGSNHHDN